MLHVKLKKKKKAYSFFWIVFAFVRVKVFACLVLEFSSIAGSVSIFPR